MNKDSGNYEISVDVSKDLEHLNGDYEMTVHVGDYRADKSQMWNIGTIHIWFKEGQDEGSNVGIKSDFKTLEPIVWTLPPPEKQISLMVIYSLFDSFL